MEDDELANLEKQFFNSYVMSASGDLYFFMIIQLGRSAVHRKRDGVMEVGSFYRVKVAKNPDAKPSMRAQLQITYAQPIEAPVQVRLEKDSRNLLHVHLTTIANLDGYVEYRGKRLLRLFNNEFGSFFDLNEIIDRREKRVEFEFKCKASPANPMKSVFYPEKVIRYYEPLSTNVKTVVGFVVSRPERAMNRVWSPELREDAFLPGRFCSRDPSGYWVQIVVNEKNEVVEDAKFKKTDVFYSRLYENEPQVLVDFSFEGYDELMKANLYRHNYMGFIGDPSGFIRNPRPGEDFEGWISRQDTLNPRCAWAICSECRLVGAREPSPRQRSPERREIDSPPPRPPQSGRTSRVGRELVLPPQVQRSRSHISSNEPALRTISRASSDDVSRAPTSEDESDEEETLQQFKPPKKKVVGRNYYSSSSSSSESRREDSSFCRDGFSDDEELAPATRRAAPSNGNQKTSHPLVDHDSDSASDQYQEQEYISRRDSPAQFYGQPSHLPPPSNASGPSSVSSSHCKSEQAMGRTRPRLDPKERNLLLLKNSFERMKILLTDFAANKKVHDAMIEHDRNSYDEMMHLVNKNNY